MNIHSFVKMFFKLIAVIGLGLIAIGLVGCPIEEAGTEEYILNIRINEANDSLLQLDELEVKVYSAGKKDSQIVFKGKLTDKNQLVGILLKPEIGKEYTVVLVGHKDGKQTLNREIGVNGGQQVSKKDVPIPEGPGPIFSIAVTKDTAVAENDSLAFLIISNDSSATLTADSLPSGSKFFTVSKRIGAFTWRPTFDQAGIYTVVFSGALGSKVLTSKTRITVSHVNRPPVLSPIENKAGLPGKRISFAIAALDPDGPSGLSVSVDSFSLPKGALFEKDSFSWVPAEDQKGHHSVKFYAYDGSLKDSAIVILSVGKLNRPPQLLLPKDTTINETDSISLLTTATDPDSGRPKISVKGLPELPKGCRIVATGLPDGQAMIVWRPDYSQGRIEPYTFLVSAEDESTKVEKELKITVRNLNRPPKLSDIGNRTVKTGDSLVFEVNASDPDGDSLTYLAYHPAEASFMNRRFSWTPKTSLPGNYNVTFIASDGSAIDSQAIIISVGAVNRPPEFQALADIASKEGDSLSVEIKATDPEGQALTISSDNLPRGATLSPISSGQARFTWKIGYDQSKSTPYEIVFTANDGEVKANQSLKVAVRNVVFAPVFSSLPLSPQNTLRPTWKWTSGGGGMGIYRCKVGDSNLENGAAIVDSGKYTHPVDLGETIHTLYVQERDSAGNWSSIASKTVVLALRKIVGAASFSLGPVNYLSLALNNAGNPYVGFVDESSGFEASVMRLNGNAWEYVGVPAFSAGKVNYTSLAASSTGTPFLGFTDNANGNKATVMRFTGSAWENVGSAGFSAGEVTYVSLAVNNTGFPYIAFLDDANGYKATVMRFTGALWENVGNPGFSPGPAFGISLALDKNNMPYIAFSDGTKRDRASVMRFNGSDWENVGTPGFSAGGSAGGVFTPSLVLDSTGIPYIAYQDRGYSGKATVMRFIGSSWENVGSPGFSDGEAGFTSLALNPSGVPYIAFVDNLNGGKATAMYFDGTSWANIGPKAFTQVKVSGTFLSMSKSGVPYIAFQEPGNDYKATVMKTSFDP